MDTNNFIDGFLANLKNFMALQKMPGNASTILCAVSGGADSMCLLDSLLHLSYPVCCAHFNHQLRGTESDRDEDFVRAYCAKAGIKLFASSGDVSAHAKCHGLSIEEAARNLRYNFLEHTATENKIPFIATAHNAGDNLETILINLTRGAGLLGLCGIPPVRGKIIRPLLFAERSDIEEYISERGISYVEDSTNFQDIYTRNRIRQKVIPVLRQINPKITRSALSASQLLREDEEYLSSLACSFISQHEKDFSLPAIKLSQLPYPVSSRVIRKMSLKALSREHVDAVLNLCRRKSGESAAVDIPGNRVFRQYDTIYFRQPQKFIWEPFEIAPGMTVDTANSGIYAKCEFIRNINDIHRSLNIFFFKSDTIYGRMTIRTRKPGDKIRLEGRNCTKSLKKLFSEKKLSQVERDSIPVICDEKGVIAVFGFGVAQRCMPSPYDDVIKIEIGEFY